MTNPVAIVTGASRGIGREVAIELAKMNYNLALLGRDAQALMETKQEISEVSPEPRTQEFICDVSGVDEINSTVESVRAHFGSIDVLINNAGVYYQESIMTMDWENYDRMIDVNLKSIIAMTKASLPSITKSTNPAIINIASIAGKHYYRSHTGYCASKFGAVAFSNALFEDLRDKGIKVSAICPGFVNTAMAAGQKIDAQDMIQVDAIAQTVRFVLEFPSSGCPTEIIIKPQNTRY